MNDLREMWSVVEAAPPDDPTPLLVAADAAAEAKLAAAEHALRWCAARGKRPWKLPVSRTPPWQWVRDQDRYHRLTKSERRARSAAVLPYLVFDAAGVNCWEVRSHTVRQAYTWLGVALVIGLGAFGFPANPVPEKPRAAVSLVTCQQCGVPRAWNVELCPVCRSGEVLR